MLSMVLSCSISSRLPPVLEVLHCPLLSNMEHVNIKPSPRLTARRSKEQATQRRASLLGQGNHHPASTLHNIRNGDLVSQNRNGRKGRKEGKSLRKGVGSAVVGVSIWPMWGYYYRECWHHMPCTPPPALSMQHWPEKLKQINKYLEI